MTTSVEDPYNLARFVTAQKDVYDEALAEIRDGRKRSHWMWFIFPQIAGLGRSSQATYYAISGADEAKAYLAHPVLGPRLKECTQATLNWTGRSALEIFGSIDEMKLRSCATLFASVSPKDSLFERLIRDFFEDEPDHSTLQILKGASGD